MKREQCIVGAKVRYGWNSGAIHRYWLLAEVLKIGAKRIKIRYEPPAKRREDAEDRYNRKGW